MGDALLPPGWTKEFSKSKGRHYFYHAATNTSKWNLEDVVPPSSAAVPSSRDGGAPARASAEEALGAKRRKVQQPKLAVIVPYRDDASHARSAQLAKFVPHMTRFLAQEAKLDEFKVFIVEQGDRRKFNRGKLLNVGFTLACREGYDAFVFHDVDLLPQPPLASYYAAVPDRPIHIARCWSRYNRNPEYLGGIVTFSKADFEAIGGFPNVYWGWGGEDDELKKRVDYARLSVSAPPVDLPDAIVDLENKTLQEKLDELRQKREEKCNVKWEVNKTHDDLREKVIKPSWWGLPVKFVLIKRDDATYERCSVVTVDVGLNFDESNGEAHWTNEKIEMI